MLGPDPRHLKHIEGDPVQVMVDWFDLQLEHAERWGIKRPAHIGSWNWILPTSLELGREIRIPKAIYSGLSRLRRFGLPIYVPIAWKQTPDRLELVDLVLSKKSNT